MILVLVVVVAASIAVAQGGGAPGGGAQGGGGGRGGGGIVSMPVSSTAFAALNAMLDLPATATRAEIEKAIEGKIVASGAFTGKVKGS
jgi:hypothetical protein